MQMKHDTGLDLELTQVLEITDFFERRNKVDALIAKGITLTSDLLEKALATYDFMVINQVLGYAIEIGLKPTTECLNIMIERRAEVASKAYYEASMRGQAVDPTYDIYALQAKTVKKLIEAGALVTPEVVKKSVNDDQSFGKNKITIALSQTQLEPTSTMLQNEFNRISEIRKNSQVLAQAIRTGTSFFNTLPKELLVRIASLMGNNENVIEENELDVKRADEFFPKLN